jgi:hypothetical protein
MGICRIPPKSSILFSLRFLCLLLFKWSLFASVHDQLARATRLSVASDPFVCELGNLFDSNIRLTDMSDSGVRYAGLGDVKNTGLAVQEAAARLHHLSFVEKRLLFFCAAHLVATPIRDLKLLLGRAQFLAAERCTALRRRMQELRMPKVRIENCPSEALDLAMDEALHCETSNEVAATVHMLHLKLITAYGRYLEQASPLADAPSCDLITSLLPLLRRITESFNAFVQTAGERYSTTRLEKFLSAAGGLDGSGPSIDNLPSRERSEKRFEIDRRSGRPSFPAMVWDYIKPPLEQTGDYFVHMLGIRLSEINVAEGLATVIFETKDKPWEFHHDLSRHLWDEIRHSMMGEAAIEALYGDAGAIPMREYERVYCMEAPPLEQYATLGIEIEGGQMRYPVGKRGEWEFCRDAAKDPLMTTFQDYDWADEVLHVNLARRQLTDWFPGGVKELSAFAQEGRMTRTKVKNRHAPVNLSVPTPLDAIQEGDH